ncbi:MAG: TrkH family potassium uptake protein, partial [Candidatus Omnitrophica bacterium]|nr:TrkH family potassium uptake protein [Candidatus Omnitrophota bacterium]
LMIVGGSTCSTTGGIKILRFIVLLSALRWLVWKRALPEEAKISLKVERVEISPNTLSVVMGFVTAYMLILFFSTLALMYLENFNFVDSLFEVASAEGTVGLSVGITRPDMNVLSKALFILNMWLGRLEIIPVLILLSPKTWMKKMRRKSLADER